MAYCSIGHMGYALLGLAAGTAEGVQGVLVYMAIYVTMTLGIFACILAMRRDGQRSRTSRDLAGLARTNPALAFFIAICCSPSPACRRSPASSPNSTCSSPRSRRALRSRYRRARQRGRRLLLSAHRQGHVFRRAGRRVRSDAGRAAAGAAVAGSFNMLFSSIRRRWSMRGRAAKSLF